MELLNLKRYTPDLESDEFSGFPPGTLFLRCDSGNDWYKSQSMFSKETNKIVVASGNEVVSCAKDISTLFPVDASVFEIDIVPDDIDTVRYIYLDGALIYSIADGAEALKAELVAAKSKCRSGRFSCSALGESRFYAIDSEAQGDLSGLIQVLQLTGGEGDGYPCSISSDGELAEEYHTLSQLQSVLIAGAQWIKAWNTYERAVLAEIVAADSRESLQAITIDFSGVTI